MPVETTLITAIPVLFVLVIAIGIIVRWVRAPRGVRSRLRHAFGPIAGAGETYQQLHTGQRGLQESIIESVQEQEHNAGGATRGDGAAGEGGAAREDDGR